MDQFACRGLRAPAFALLDAYGLVVAGDLGGRLGNHLAGSNTLTGWRSLATVVMSAANL
jgi:hypothetical protein